MALRIKKDSLLFKSNAPTPDVTVTFYDNYIPSLKGGEYTITAGQDLKVDEMKTILDGGNHVVDANPQADTNQRFIVRGPRFVLDPTDVNLKFPHNRAVGSFSNFLPMVVLDKRSLPWERDLNLTKQGITNSGPYPWMALLVFSEDELISMDTTASTDEGSLANPTKSASIKLSALMSPPQGTAAPTLTLSDDENPDTQFCNVIEVTAATFANVVPTLNDMRFLCHVREVATDNKVPQQTTQDGWYSSIVANRFCMQPADQAGSKKNIVHLVSLEGLEQFLGKDTAGTVTGFNKVRMISLASWTFDCLHDPKENFSKLMTNLLSPESANGTQLLLKMPVSVAQPGVIKTRMDKGYVPLSYATLTGEQTFAWYRGPLAPVVAPPLVNAMDVTNPVDNNTPLNTSEAMIYDPATGLFDQSYAVAFQTGRSLALANQPFATDLIQWRRSAQGLVDKLVQQLRSPVMKQMMRAKRTSLMLKMDSNDLLGGAGVADLVQLLEGNMIAESYKTYLANDFMPMAKSVGNAEEPAQIDTDTIIEINQAMQMNDIPEPPLMPAEIHEYMENKTVVSLLEHYSGIAAIGHTTTVLSGETNTIVLTGGATEAMGVGTTLTLANSGGGDSPQVIVFAPVSVGDNQIEIFPYNFTPALPQGCAVQICQKTILPASVVNWLSKTALLYSVPFNNLVPDARFLQQETIRFFYFDQNWINALIDGALSIGIQSSRDNKFSLLMRGKLLSTINRSTMDVRDEMRKLLTGNANANAAAPGTKAGFLLRSTVVQSCPGLEVKAYSAADPVNPMKALRLDHMAPDILLAVFPNVPVRIELSEPSEGLVFGYEDQGVSLRYLPGTNGATASNIGFMLNPHTYLPNAASFVRTGSVGQPVLNIAGTGGLVQAIQQKFQAPQPTLTPASFAVQMVKVPEQLLFTPLTASNS
jgi:hypothetical protein